jgi:ABC-type Fe3+/spermidine/putrescine transport system ATPase subunit
MSLTVKDLFVRRGTFCLKVKEVVAQPGEVLALVGASGSGKSTFLSTLAGFLEPTSGSILFNEKDVTKLAPEKRNFAYLFQKPALFPHLTVLENVEFSLRARGVLKAERELIAREWLHHLGMADLESRRPHQLSGGQAQRVALARAFVADFPVLLLDEPFTGLDTELRETLKEMILGYTQSKRCITILVSHDESDIAELADSVALFEGGLVSLTQRV